MKQFDDEKKLIVNTVMLFAAMALMSKMGPEEAEKFIMEMSNGIVDRALRKIWEAGAEAAIDGKTDLDVTLGKKT